LTKINICGKINLQRDRVAPESRNSERLLSALFIIGVIIIYGRINMAEKYTYDFVKNYIESKGCLLLDLQYNGVKNKMQVIGLCRHEYSTSFDMFKNKKQYVCPKCGREKGGNKRKSSYDEVFNYIKNKGCKLLSDFYLKNDENLKILFSCGHIGFRSFANFKVSNPVCYECSGIKKYDFDDIKKCLEEYGYYYNEGNYNDVHSKIFVSDNFGYEYLTSYHQVETNYKSNNKIREFDIRNPFTLNNINNWVNINKKHFYLIDNIYEGKNKKMFWQCTNDDCEEFFDASWHSIISGHGCPYCSVPAKKIGKRNNLMYKYPEIAKEFDEFKNGVSASSILCGSNNKYYWICPNCGVSYLSKPASRTNDIGCPVCCESHSEKFVRDFLEKNNIKFNPQHKFENCVDKRTLPFDFYLTDYNICLESQGEQHFRPIDFFGGEEGFIIRKKHDQIKKIYCIENSIKLIEIPYWDFKNIDQILTKELNLQ